MNIGFAIAFVHVRVYCARINRPMVDEQMVKKVSSLMAYNEEITLDQAWIQLGIAATTAANATASKSDTAEEMPPMELDAETQADPSKMKTYDAVTAGYNAIKHKQHEDRERFERGHIIELYYIQMKQLLVDEVDLFRKALLWELWGIHRTANCQHHCQAFLIASAWIASQGPKVLHHCQAFLTASACFASQGPKVLHHCQAFLIASACFGGRPGVLAPGAQVQGVVPQAQAVRGRPGLVALRGP